MTYLIITQLFLSWITQTHNFFNDENKKRKKLLMAMHTIND